MSSAASPRPKTVTLLVLGVLTIAGFNLARFAQAVALWRFLREFSAVSPLYLAGSGLVWGAAGLMIAWGLWRGSRWAPRFILFFTLAYSLYYWIDRLWLSERGSWSNAAFALGVNGFLVLITVWISSRPSVRAYFGVNHERSE